MQSAIKPTQAMILAAGHGRRMGPITRKIPKPLLAVDGKPLVVHHILNLSRAGIRHLVINHGPLGTCIEKALGNGTRYGVQIHYSPEGLSPLDTAGGVVEALRRGHLATAPFLLVNADVYTLIDFSSLRLPEPSLAHIILVNNPVHNPQGDFQLHGGLVYQKPGHRKTYSGIGIYHHEIFTALARGARPLVEVLKSLIGRGVLSGEYFSGLWLDVGTPERLALANRSAISIGTAPIQPTN